MAFDNWVTFSDGSAGCIVQPPGDEGMTVKRAMKIAAEVTGKTPVSCRALPYAATPVLNRSDDWPAGWAMTLCFAPGECAGLSSCPQRRACSE